MDFPINFECLKFTGQGEKGQVLILLLSLEQQVKELILKEQAMYVNFQSFKHEMQVTKNPVLQETPKNQEFFFEYKL